MINESGKRVSGADPIKAIACMHERSNGLGGGFAGYGIYPEMKDHYALHVLYHGEESQRFTDAFLHQKLAIVKSEPIPTRKHPNIKNAPILWRYFADVPQDIPDDMTEEDYIVDLVMKVNSTFDGAYIVSSGKNMGVFKASGYPEDVGEFYRLDEYGGYLWTVHGRFPTNTPGWWGGAHPFGLLDSTVVHNGEISSYGINKRYAEMFGYKCTLQTDSEVVMYLWDLLVRRHRLPMDLACQVLAAPFWKDIDAMDEDRRAALTALRQVYGSALLNGPFSIIVGFTGGMVGLSDRIMLRPLVAARKDDFVYMSSEEAAIRAVAPQLDEIWTGRGGVPIIATLKETAAQPAALGAARAS